MSAAAAAEFTPMAVLSILFPSSVEPQAGLFIRERMFRVAAHVPVVVIAPQPWFPLQGLLRLWRPNYRPPKPRHETQQGIEVHFPRFLAVPGMLRRLDGLFIALACRRLLARLQRERGIGVIDAHFAYPSGRAATLLARWLGMASTITLRGTEPRQLADPSLRREVLAALDEATRVFSVSQSLKDCVVEAGASAAKVHVVGNGVDLSKFRRIDRQEARAQLGLAPDDAVLVSVGGLVPRKGFHRVLEVLPALRERHPRLRYLIVGGPSPEGDHGPQLRAQVAAAGLEDCVVFTGPLPAERLHVPLSAADVFVLSTANEGWANVFLEAMACGLPVVTTRVGGNAEVVNSGSLGLLVPLGDADALREAIHEALGREWDREAIVAYARANTWDSRVRTLLDHFADIRRSGVQP
jgi:teichuronic acid biosynthesis glycosyltransferase TuaC